MEGTPTSAFRVRGVPPVPPPPAMVPVRCSLSRCRVVAPLGARRPPARLRRARRRGATTMTTRHKEMSSKAKEQEKQGLHSHTSCRSFPGFSAQCHSSSVFGPRRLCLCLRRRWSSVRADSGSEGSTEARLTDEARLPVPGMANAKESVT